MHLTSQQKRAINFFCRKNHIQLMVLFGSQASGEATSQSDIDIALYGKKIFSSRELTLFAFALSQIFQQSNIDLVDIKNASPLLLQQIFSRGVKLYEKEKYSFFDFQMYADRLFAEARPLFDLQKKYLVKKISRQYV